MPVRDFGPELCVNAHHAFRGEPPKQCGRPWISPKAAFPRAVAILDTAFVVSGATFAFIPSPNQTLDAFCQKRMWIMMTVDQPFLLPERMWIMMTADKPLLSLTAADLMTPAVLSIPQDMSLQAAAHMLAQANVSGAPVVDEDGRCVGVISAHDFVALVDKGTRAARQLGQKECFCSAWQIEADEQLPEDAVRNYMTADPVTVLPGTRTGVLARTMVDAHIHRVIVLDRTGRPIGIVSSIDVLAAVARAARADGSTVEQESSHEHHEEYCCPTADIAGSDRRRADDVRSGVAAG
jgi:CBS domain-containing protein